MSDAPPEITPEVTQAAIARDRRVAEAIEGVEVSSEILNSPSLRSVMKQLNADADNAMEQFAFVNPADTTAIIGLQARVFCAVYTAKVLVEVQRRGRMSEESLKLEEQEQH